jgi:hypothetical protein
MIGSRFFEMEGMKSYLAKMYTSNISCFLIINGKYIRSYNKYNLIKKIEIYIHDCTISIDSRSVICENITAWLSTQPTRKDIHLLAMALSIVGDVSTLFIARLSIVGMSVLLCCSPQYGAE